MAKKTETHDTVTYHSFSLFTDFDIQPVISRPSMSLEYFENKKLYFIKWHDGVIRGVN